MSRSARRRRRLVAVGFELLSGWTAEAERRGFVVVYPDQNNLANPAGCWNWFLSSNQHRGLGEPSLIAGITNQVKARYTIDPAGSSSPESRPAA